MSRNIAYDRKLEELCRQLTTPGALTGLGSAEREESARTRAHELCARMLATYEAKDTDYSENDLPMGNFRESEEQGLAPWRGILLRIGDKKRRIGSFVRRDAYLVKDEGVDDTLVDLSNYCLLGLVLFEETKFSNDLITGRDYPDYAPLVCENGEGVATFAIPEARYVKNLWMRLAFHALHSKILFEYRDQGVDDWRGKPWTGINRAYKMLADFAKQTRFDD